jgi:hypothetical protein
LVVDIVNEFTRALFGQFFPENHLLGNLFRKIRTQHSARQYFNKYGGFLLSHHAAKGKMAHPRA